MRSGIVNIASSQLRYSGQYGYYWALQPYSSPNYAYALYFLSDSISPSGRGDRYASLSLRCLAS